jgi:hypothetical protein
MFIAQLPEDCPAQFFDLGQNGGVYPYSRFCGGSPQHLNALCGRKAKPPSEEFRRAPLRTGRHPASSGLAASSVRAGLCLQCEVPVTGRSVNQTVAGSNLLGEPNIPTSEFSGVRLTSRRAQPTWNGHKPRRFSSPVRPSGALFAFGRSLGPKFSVSPPMSARSLTERVPAHEHEDDRRWIEACPRGPRRFRCAAGVCTEESIAEQGEACTRGP